MGIVIGLFGVPRHVPTTLDNLLKCIVQPARLFSNDVRICCHLNIPERIVNERSGETGEKIVTTGLERLGCEIQWCEPQISERVASEFELITSSHDAIGDPSKQSHLNIMLQYYSLNRLHHLIFNTMKSECDIYCIVRADLLFHDIFDFFEIDSAIRNGIDLLVPAWQSWGGLNDRFAICSPKGAVHYMNRDKDLGCFISEFNYFHPEQMLKYVSEKHNLTKSFIPYRATRVRSGGAVKGEKFRHDNKPAYKLDFTYNFMSLLDIVRKIATFELKVSVELVCDNLWLHDTGEVSSHHQLPAYCWTISSNKLIFLQNGIVRYIFSNCSTQDGCISFIGERFEDHEHAVLEVVW